ncbi:Hypothetical protein Rta_08410 [Ramlibacter tataouinensis TTB310]|uniref:Uncharacterized protein n=1 Tax=Ramlibacter tataouinensis (strain ATCC BAA-407 / DSM 14655 / LMG 21543 / TTB310) TaxID=365046 RepID=F5XYC9_RAMTT|nr:Hypothetical protein Rta_08410 [Ramlibacter tataouinensis TTB310]
MQALEAIDLPHHQEDHEGQDGEVEHDGEEAAPGKDRHAGLDQVGQDVGNALGHAAEHHELAGEVQVAADQADHRHDDVPDQRIDDLAERRADDDADGQVDHVALDGEFAEFLEHAHAVRSSTVKPKGCSIPQGRVGLPLTLNRRETLRYNRGLT